MDEYIKQATDFLQKTYSKMKIEYVGLAVNKEWKEKEKHCLYEITLTSPRGSMTFDFWDSIRNTRIRTMPFDAYNVQANKELAAKKKAAVPSVYDVLACLQKCDPGTFENFCSDYGYDEDSRTAIRVYLAVQNEYTQLTRLFTPEQMEELAEIN